MKLLKYLAIIFIGLLVIGALSGNAGSGTATNNAAPSATQPTDVVAQATDEPTDVPTDVPPDVPTEQPAPSATAIPVITVDILTLAEQYDGNKLRAQAYYKDHVIRTTGTASDVSQDILGSYFVSLRPGGDYYGLTQVQCYVSNESQLVNITNGQGVTVQGRVDDMTLGIIPLHDCQVVS